MTNASGPLNNKYIEGTIEYVQKPKGNLLILVSFRVLYMMAFLFHVPL